MVRIVVISVISILDIVLVISPSILWLDDCVSKGISVDWTRDEIVGLVLCGVFIVSSSLSSIILTKATGKVKGNHLALYLNMGVVLISSSMIVTSGGILEVYVEETLYYIMIILFQYIVQILMAESARLEKNVGRGL